MGGSINEFISSEFTTVQYENIDHIINLVQKFGVGALIAKADIEDAFRIVPIYPKDYHLLGFKYDNKFYFDKSLPMGCSISCQTFERFSCALQWILVHHFQISGMSHILDDYIFVGPENSELCKSALSAFYPMANELRIPLKISKTVEPTTCCIVHGIEIDTVAGELRMPLDKLGKLTDMIKHIEARRTITFKELKSLIGLLSFACHVVAPGRTFLRRL